MKIAMCFYGLAGRADNFQGTQNWIGAGENNLDCDVAYRHYKHHVFDKNDQIDIFFARAKSYCQAYAHFLKHKGLIFKEKSQSMDDRGKLKSSFPEKCKQIIESWHTLQEGNLIKGTDYIKMVKEIKPKYISERKKTAMSSKDTAPPELYTGELFSYEILKNKYHFDAPLDKMWHDIFSLTQLELKDQKNLTLYL